MDVEPHQVFTSDDHVRSDSAVDKSVETARHALVVHALRVLRERADLTQAELAAVIAEDQRTVSAIEVGKRRVDIVELRAILEGLGEPAAALVAQLDALEAMMVALAGEPHQP